MAEDTLVALDIETGRAFIDQLAREGFPLKAAAWVYERAVEDWRLYLVTPIRNRDFLSAYVRASQAILADDERKDELKRISFNIVDSKEPLGKTLMRWAKSTHRDHERISESSPQGTVVDAVVYGVAA